jgi:hypothetical protein
MPRDSQGRVLELGDVVYVPCRVTSIKENTDLVKITTQIPFGPTLRGANIVLMGNQVIRKNELADMERL